ncbi:MAG: lipopolysaccharide biosynthesis protein [Lachnospiraceae bacterium]|nr:lipopolysaccharide biosynthesis protein [Lachnospiraceae bacterium]
MEENIISKTKIFRNLFWKFGERISAQLISLIVSIILARLLSPDEYGAVGLIMTFITIANVFVSSGLGNALIQKKDADNIDFSSVFWINLAISIVLYLILYFISPCIANFYKMPILSPALRVLGLRIIIAAINSVQQAYVSKNFLFKRFFVSTIFGALISGVIGIVLAYRGFGAWALVIQYLSNTCIGTIVLWIALKWHPVFKCSWQRVKVMFAYGWKILVSGLIDVGYKELRSLIIGKKYTPSELAYYNQGDKYPSLIVVNINNSISSVLFPAIAQFQDDKDRVKQMTRRAIQISSYIMWPLMIGFATISEPLIRLVLTEKWLPCVPYVRIFCFSYGFWPIHTANLQAINALGRSDIFLKIEVVKKILGFVVVLLTMNFGPLAMAYSVIFIDLFSTLINSFPNKILLNYKYVEQVKDILPSFILAIIMSLCISFVNSLLLSDMVKILIQVFLGAIIYLLLSILTKQKAFRFLINSLIRK